MSGRATGSFLDLVIGEENRVICKRDVLSKKCNGKKVGRIRAEHTHKVEEEEDDDSIESNDLESRT